MMISEANFHPSVADDDFKRFLRFPPSRPFEGPLAENAEWVRAWYGKHGRPWWVAREVTIEPGAETHLYLDGVPFATPVVTRRFSDATTAVVVAASAGAEADEEAAARWAADEPDRYFFMECYAAAVVEALLVAAGQRLAAWGGQRGLLPPYCPGYPGWPINDTPAFLALVRGSDQLPGALETLSSGMLRPKKSQLALFAFTTANEPVAR